MSVTVKSFVLRKLNRNKAALLMLEARHIGVASRNDGVCVLCRVPIYNGGCRNILNLRAEVAAGEVALKQAEQLR